MGELETKLSTEWDNLYYPAERVEAVEPEGLPMESPAGSQAVTPTEFAMDIGNLAKGVVTGAMGVVGDTISIGRGLYEIGRRGGDESALDAFLKGMEGQTIAPTTEDINKWIDENVPLPERMKGGSVPGFVGEVVAPASALIKGTKAGAKGLKKVNKILTAPKVETPAFNKWFGNSTTIDESGNPQVWYHGTGKNFEIFKPGVSDAIFFTREPKFAEDFTDAKPHKRLSPDELKSSMAEGNIIPVYLKAENPFDYENSKHRKMVIDFLFKKHGKKANGETGVLIGGKLFDKEMLDEMFFSEASWAFTELDQVQNAIRSLGFDSFFVEEIGVKNLAVFKPEQVKSVFNKGTFDPNDPRMLNSGVGVVATGAGSATMDKEQKAK